MQHINNKSDGKNLKILLVGNDGSGKTEFSRKLSHMNKSLTSQKEFEIDFTKVKIEDRTIAVVQTLSLDRFEDINEHAYKANDYQGVVILADDKFKLSETLIKKQKEIPFVNAADYANPEDCITALYEKIKSQEQKQKSFFKQPKSSSKSEKEESQATHEDEKKTTDVNTDSSGNFFSKKITDIRQAFNLFDKSIAEKIKQLQVQNAKKPDPKQFTLN